MGLNNSSDEDVWGKWIDDVTGEIYLTTRGLFAISGVIGSREDVFICAPITLGATTSCNFGPGLFWDGSANGYTGERSDGIAIQQP